MKATREQADQIAQYSVVVQSALCDFLKSLRVHVLDLPGSMAMLGEAVAMQTLLNQFLSDQPPARQLQFHRMVELYAAAQAADAESTVTKTRERVEDEEGAV